MDNFTFEQLLEKIGDKFVRLWLVPKDCIHHFQSWGGSLSGFETEFGMIHPPVYMECLKCKYKTYSVELMGNQEIIEADKKWMKKKNTEEKNKGRWRAIITLSEYSMWESEGNSPEEALAKALLRLNYEQND